MTLKMAEFAPMPSASARTATTVKPGVFSSVQLADFPALVLQGSWVTSGACRAR
jgi:hypothetical protein